jgi:hypothetical protein
MNLVLDYIVVVVVEVVVEVVPIELTEVVKLL